MTSQSSLVIVTIDGNVELVLLVEVLHHGVNVVHTLGTTSHGLSGEVAVATRTIPVWEKLWCE